MPKTVLITGATGKQGGSVINALLQQEEQDSEPKWEILALTRDAKSASAQRLANKSSTIKLVTGDLDHPRAVFESARQVASAPIWGVFSVQALAIGFTVPKDLEETQGKGLIDAAIEAGVQHFVYTSVDRGAEASDDNPTDIPHFITKHNIEQHLYTATAGGGKMTWTVLRPVAFFDNLVPGFMGKLFATSFEMSLRAEQKLQLIATSDIGYFAALAFSKPEEFAGKKVSLAGEEMTFGQFKATFEKTTGQVLPTTFWLVAMAIHWMSKELGSMFRWFREVGYAADIAAVREMDPGVKDFETWLRQESQFREA